MSRLTKAWRDALARWGQCRRLPRALIIGAQKSGTSALFSYLAQCPWLEASRQKELDFFGSDFLYNKGLAWYASNWREKATGALRFEASPLYLVSHPAAKRIAETLPNVKLIAVLRDPVERAYSSWRMYRAQLTADPDFYNRLRAERYSPAQCGRDLPRSTREIHDFSAAVESEAECLRRGEYKQCSVLDIGLYGPQLRRFLNFFPRKQLLVLDSQDLLERRVQTLHQVLQFLELPDWDWSRADLAEVHVGVRDSNMTDAVRDFLDEFYRESNQMLWGLLDSPPKFARPEGTAAACARPVLARA
jgi:hypothetical protein